MARKSKQLGIGLNVKQEISENSFYSGLPSALADISGSLLQLVRDGKKDGPKPWDTNPYSIDDKINYNCIEAHREIIEQFGEWSPALESLYDTIDEAEPGFKSEILSSFQDRYAMVRAAIFTESPLPKKTAAEKLIILQQNADEIIRRVSAELRDDLSRVGNANLRLENLTKVCLIATCHAFLNCKILEKPPT